MSEIQIGPSEWGLWKQNPVTQEVFRALEEIRQDYIDYLINGEFLRRDAKVDGATAVGTVKGINVTLGGIEELLREQWREAEQRKEDARGGE